MLEIDDDMECETCGGTLCQEIEDDLGSEISNEEEVSIFCDINL